MTYPTQEIPSNNPRNIVVSDPVAMTFTTRNPTAQDNTYHPGSEWQNTITGQFWKCKSSGITGAVWVPFIPGGTGLLDTLTGNSGGAVGPDGLSNVNVIGDGTTINVAGNAGTNTLTISLVGGGVPSESFTTTVGGPVVPTGAGVIALTGATSTYTIGSVANTIRTEVQGTNHAVFIGKGVNTPASTIPVGTNGQVIVGATGADPAFATLTSADSSILFTLGANTLALRVNNALVGETITGNSGGALSPTAGNWNILGARVAAGSTPVATSGAVSTLTVNVQTSQAIAATDATKIGLAAFNSADFTVDANGFVGLVGGVAAIGKINVQTGTSPIVPAAGAITINGATVAAGTNPVRTDGTGANTLALEVQTSQAIAAADATKIGLAAFNSANFTVDGTGFVSLLGTDAIQTLTGNSGGALSPVAGNMNTLGTGSITISGAGNTLTTQLTGLTNHSVLVGAGTATITKLGVGTNGQVLIGATAADPAFATLTSSDSTILFTTGVNSLSLQVNPAKVGETITGASGGALSPTLGNWNIIGAATAAGSTPVTTAGAVSTLTVNVQTSQAIASTDATKIGLAAFNSADFTVDANGFVSFTGTAVPTTLTGNSGGAVGPTANNINTVGTGSITVVGSPGTSTLTAQLTGLTNHAVLVGAGTATITKVGPSASTGQILQNNSGADPSYSTATYPSTTTINQILYSSAANTVTGLATANGGVVDTSPTGVPQVDTTNFAVLTTGLQLKGNNTNTVPPAGFIGEQIRSFVDGSSTVALTTNVTANITSINLTAGIWDISYVLAFTTNGSTTTLFTQLVSDVSTVSATLSGNFGDTSLIYSPGAAGQVFTNFWCTLPAYRVTLAAPTTYYLVANASFTVSVCQAYGRISATRVG